MLLPLFYVKNWWKSIFQFIFMSKWFLKDSFNGYCRKNWKKYYVKSFFWWNELENIINFLCRTQSNMIVMTSGSHVFQSKNNPLKIFMVFVGLVLNYWNYRLNLNFQYANFPFSFTKILIFFNFLKKFWFPGDLPGESGNKFSFFPLMRNFHETEFFSDRQKMSKFICIKFMS